MQVAVGGARDFGNVHSLYRSSVWRTSSIARTSFLIGGQPENFKIIFSTAPGPANLSVLPVADLPKV
jgi:hypothetical protein